MIARFKIINWINRVNIKKMKILSKFQKAIKIQIIKRKVLKFLIEIYKE